MDVAAIVPAAGLGRRFRSRRAKVLFPVSGRPLLVHTLKNLRRSYPFKELVVLVRAKDIPSVTTMLRGHRLNGVRVERGGATRAESVRRGVESLKSGARWVLVHDAARPLITKSLVRRTISAARATGVSLCAMPATATVKRTAGAKPVVVATEDRSSLWLAQTPQVFRRNALIARYRALGRRAMKATDEAALFDGTRTKVRIVPGEVRNIKITTKEDLELFQYYASRR